MQSRSCVYSGMVGVCLQPDLGYCVRATHMLVSLLSTIFWAVYARTAVRDAP